MPYLLNGAFHRLAVWEWGDPAAAPVVCVHGLTRQGRDFDALAAELAADRYVLCPDLPGRGESDWLPEAALYQPLSYVQALAHLLARVGRPAAWVGTSLGGICGMLLAAAPGVPITRMVLNDIGPFVPRAALARIRDYMTPEKTFASLDAAADYFATVHAPFGKLTRAQWLDLARHSTRPRPEGGLRLHYDPRMAEPIRAAEPQDMDLSAVWARIDLPLLTLRGATSDLLLAETLTDMAAKSATHVVADAGHAPALQDAETIGIVAGFVRQT